LRAAYPIINFLLLRYGDDDEEVIFGWGHHPADPNGRVFLSRNPRLLAAFEAYWRTLQADSVAVTRSAPPLAPRDIVGLWFDVAYDLDAVSPTDVESVRVEPERPRDVALVRISIRDNRLLTIEGRVFCPTTFSALNRFRSTASDLTDRDLWFAIGDETVFGAGYYSFIPAKADGTFSVDEFHGEFLDCRRPRDTGPEATRKIRVTGRRVAGHDDFPPDPRAEKNLVEKCWYELVAGTPPPFR
jgi:hypothetical protein